MWRLRALIMRRQATQVKALGWGSLIGAGFSFLNLPVYFCAGYVAIIEMGMHRMDRVVMGFLGQEPLEYFSRAFVLFTFTGATCGAWVGWQAYKERHPKCGFFPRFSLRTLVLLAMGWGMLLALFMPE